jgi:hypothetical protein
VTTIWQTREQVERAIRAFQKRKGRPPLTKEFTAQNKLPIPKTVNRLYGGPPSVAVAAAGLEPRRREFWTKRKLVEWVRAFENEAGRMPTTGDIADAPPRWRTFKRFWENGLAGAIAEAKRDA